MDLVTSVGWRWRRVLDYRRSTVVSGGVVLGQERQEWVLWLPMAALATGGSEEWEGGKEVEIYRAFLALALRKPTLIPAMVGMAWSARARQWYRRPPFLPLPPASYIRWRMETAYGDRDAVPPLDELARFLRWAREMRRTGKL